jgi:hypothetical protein
MEQEDKDLGTRRSGIWVKKIYGKHTSDGGFSQEQLSRAEQSVPPPNRR